MSRAPEDWLNWKNPRNLNPHAKSGLSGMGRLCTVGAVMRLVTMKFLQIMRSTCGIAIVLAILSPPGHAQELIHGRKSLVLENQVARLVVDLGGGSLGE